VPKAQLKPLVAKMLRRLPDVEVTQLPVRLYTCLHTYIHTHTHICTYIHTHIYIYIYIYIYINKYICISKMLCRLPDVEVTQLPVRIRIHMYIDTYI